jgi:hypothetical protein
MATAINLNLIDMKTTKLEKLNACSGAREWALTQKNPTEAWQNCERGDWMLWLAKKLNVDDKKLTMAKAMCAKQVEYLMKDQRSKDALQACFDYANGKITREQLNDYAYAAAYAAADDDADHAVFAAQVSLKKSADICRKYLTEEVIAKYKRLR